MPSYVVEVWRDGGPGSGTLVMRSYTNGQLFSDFTRDSPVAGSHTYSVYAATSDVSGSTGNVGFTRMSLLMAHR